MNDDFYTSANQRFYAKCLRYYERNTINKPIVFLPCANASKTRGKYGKKRISQSFTHQLMSAITRDGSLEKIIISEPLTIIPYRFEDEMPDYDYPPKLLHKKPDDLVLKDDWQLKRRLSIFLRVLYEKGVGRVYYCGGYHHYNLLKAANMGMLEIIAVLSREGTRDYARIAKELRKKILEIEQGEILERTVLPKTHSSLFGKSPTTFRSEIKWAGGT